MARRKKEPQNVHRKNISSAAEQLFTEKGIENTSMNDIAKVAGYSKATIYVYFKNKEELVSILVLESMQKLYQAISMTLEDTNDTKTGFISICNSVVKYQEKYPLYFKMLLDNINIDFENRNFLPEEKETFLVGEAINNLLITFLEKGIKKGDLRSDIQILPTIFLCWGMFSGLIQLATNKEEYIFQQTGLSREEFLSNGFDAFYNSFLAI